MPSIGGYDLADPADRVFAFDYSGSGRLDHLVLYRPGQGTIWILRNSAGTFSPVYPILWYELHSPADRVWSLDVVRNRDGRLEVFGISSDERIWHTWQVTAGGAWNGGWVELYDSTNRLRSLDSARNQDGRLEVFGVSLTERIWHTWQLSPGNWSPSQQGPAATPGFSPTIRYADVHGYEYDETSNAWKDLCSVLPCFLALQWPGYPSTIVEDTIDGQPVVIQLWKGLCQQFLGRPDFPGGVGAEVGVYRRILGRSRPTSIPFFSVPGALQFLTMMAGLGDQFLWWPAPDLHATLEFKLINPNTGETFFCAGAESSYWLAKWMQPSSYDTYRADVGGNTPGVDGYLLEYRINGKTYPRW